MKLYMNMNSAKLLTAGVLPLVLFNSCYFNSAGHIFDKASHKAAVNMADLTSGSNIYVDGDSYYVELPRYRAGKPILTQYYVDDETERKEVLKPTGDTTMVEIPQNYAMYLTGQNNAPATPGYMQKSEEAPDDIKKRSLTLTTVRTPEAARHDFRYSSPNAAGWYTLGVLDWLCVDLPVTCVENSLVLCGLVYIALDAAAKERAEQERKFQESISDKPGFSSEEASIIIMQRNYEDAYREVLKAQGNYYGPEVPPRL